MSEYVKTCTYCKNEIQMSDKEGRWLPYNQDGSQHDCKKSVPNNGNSNDISVEVLLKKLESIGVKIDLSKLRNTVNADNKK